MNDTDYLEFELTLWCKRNNDPGLGLWSLIKQGRADEAGKILDELKTKEFLKFIDNKSLEAAKAKLDELKYTIPDHLEDDHRLIFRDASYAIMNGKSKEAWFELNKLEEYVG